MRKMAKAVALRVAEKAKEDKAKELAEKEKGNNKNFRNKRITYSPNSTTNASNNEQRNQSRNGARKPESVGMVKLPKVSTSGSNSNNISAKGIAENPSIKRASQEGTIGNESKE